jgi:hypothetical protein
VLVYSTNKFVDKIRGRRERQIGDIGGKLGKTGMHPIMECKSDKV